MKSFSLARLKLTAWYALVLAIVSISLSSLLYFRTSQIIDLQYHQLNRRLTGHGQMRVLRQPTDNLNFLEEQQQILSSELNTVHQELLQRILSINLLIILIGAGASYLLSGKTLQPIQVALDQQQQFVEDAAHELKTPLTALQTSLEVNLMDKKLDSIAKKILQENLEDVIRLNNLSNRLLQLAQHPNNQQSINYSSVDLKTVIKRAIRQIQPLANKKEIKLVFELKRNKTDRYKVLGDHEKLTEAIIILLDNAIKYSQKGKKVFLQLTSNKKMLMLEIKDQGRGIAKEELDKIFNRFYRSDSSRYKESSNQTSGFGLGLALAKQIVENHQGIIKVESLPDKGTVFKILLKKI